MSFDGPFQPKLSHDSGEPVHHCALSRRMTSCQVWNMHSHPQAPAACSSLGTRVLPASCRHAGCCPEMLRHNGNPTQLVPAPPRAHGPWPHLGWWVWPKPSSLAQPCPKPPAIPRLLPDLQGEGKALPWGDIPMPGDPWAHAPQVHGLGRPVAKEVSGSWVRIWPLCPCRCCAASSAASLPCTGVQGLSFSAEPSDPAGLSLSKIPNSCWQGALETWPEGC